MKILKLLMKFDKFIDDIYLPYVHRTFELSTYDNYTRLLRIPKKELDHVRLGFIRKKHILTFFKNAEKRGITKNTMTQYKKVLNAIFNFAIREKMKRKNPIKGISIKATKSRAAIYSPEEVERLLRFINKNYPLIYMPVFLVVNTGMRRGEVLGLFWENIDFNRKEITISQSLIRSSGGSIYIKKPKTPSSIRIIGISDEVVEYLIKLKEKATSEFVVIGWNGKRMDPQYLTNNFSKAVNESGLPKRRFHDLRHTHASLLLAAGESIHLVSKRLGHSDIKITLSTYAHLLPTQQHKAANKLSIMFKEAREKINISV